MERFYTNEKSIQLLISLLKQHSIKRFIVSPGTTNIRLVASIQQDKYFEIYSAPDERSAAYMACGMAEETKEPVVLSCTGATASRNYIPGLTEAFYRKIPVLVVTISPHAAYVGQNIPQVLDRTTVLKDMLNYSAHVSACENSNDVWHNTVKMNEAILALSRNGGGPAHINLETVFSSDFSVKVLPTARKISRVVNGGDFPDVPNGKIAIFVGAHSRWNPLLVKYVEAFCEKYNAVVLCDQTSNYRGKFRVLFNLVTTQDYTAGTCAQIDLLISIGNISGAYPKFKTKQEWRLHPDGEIRDTYQHLSYVFQMDEIAFFKHYTEIDIEKQGTSYYDQWMTELNQIRENFPEVPFSNIWIAQQMSSMIPQQAILHLGILNSLRSWNFFETPESVSVYCNTGGFGIDGILSTALGASLVAENKNVFVVLGDLAFFYDMNSLGNRHLSSNLRILLINNGRGTEFRNYNHPGAWFGEESDKYIAAAGHYGFKSANLVMHYAQDLGFKYISADSKETFIEQISQFVGVCDKSIIFEVFTDSVDESLALKLVNSISRPKDSALKGTAKKILGENGVKVLREIKAKGFGIIFGGGYNS